MKYFKSWRVVVLVKHWRPNKSRGLPKTRVSHEGADAVAISHVNRSQADGGGSGDEINR